MLLRGWAEILERRGVIFVSAENSGNEANVLDRREPLALLAAPNTMQRYRVDPQQTIFLPPAMSRGRAECSIRSMCAMGVSPRREVWTSRRVSMR
jgi:hypothetical protein